MELTNHQAQQIENYLNARGLHYIDFRIEIFDHIASEIEYLLEEGIAFENAFHQVTDKWNEQLKDSYSFMFGVLFTAPKVVIDKAKKKFKSTFLLIIALGIASFIQISYEIQPFDFLLSENALTILLGITGVFWLIICARIFSDPHKTLYSFLIKTQAATVFLIPMVLYTSLGTIAGAGFSLLILMIFCHVILFYKKHQKEKEKHLVFTK